MAKTPPKPIKPAKGKAAPKVSAKKTAQKTPPARKTPIKKTNSVGRPSSYRPEFREQAYKLTLLGADDKRLADFFKVHEATVNLWKTKHPEFYESINEGKDLADAEIAKSLYHRAKGYSHQEDDIRTVAQGANMGSEIVITPTIKHYPPDTQAASLWLRNRQPKLWRDKVELEHSGQDGGAIKTESTVIISADEAYKRMLGGQ